ncbi:MAG: TIGR04086 family membrane protein [Tissierellia bacterium]|nr:TIGR04086 family membrane protein [Tissierellia bacterium]
MKTKSLGKITYLLKGLVLAFIITAILILISSILLTYTNLSESKMNLLNTIVMIISITAGSAYVAVMVKEKGWINGGLLGLCYYLILLLINILFLKPLVVDVYLFSRLIISIVMGIIGGIIGINMA